MNHFEVAPQVPTLRKGLHTEGTCEGAVASVLSEVVAQVAALFEDSFATLQTTPKKKPESLGFLIAHLDGLVPFIRDFSQSPKGLRARPKLPWLLPRRHWSSPVPKLALVS